jgi:hypothetical protein
MGQFNPSLDTKHEWLISFIFIVVPRILKSKARHLPTDALFITLGKV